VSNADAVHIARAVIVGVTEVDPNPETLALDDHIDVLVHLRGAVPAVQVRAVRRDAQAMYSGLNRLIATAHIARFGAPPAIVGEYSVEAHSIDGVRTPELDRTFVA
jgi:hypothetical protein